MRTFALAAISFAILFAASLVYADKLAPPQNTLQPLPANVQPAVSQNVQRSASPTDLQTIEAVQAAEENSPSQNTDENAMPLAPSLGSLSSDPLALWFALGIAVLIAGGAVWLWKSF